MRVVFQSRAKPFIKKLFWKTFVQYGHWTIWLAQVWTIGYLKILTIEHILFHEEENTS